MYEDLKYALDKLFTFMLFISIGMLLVGTMVDTPESAIHAVEGIDLAVLGGYYVFFFIGLRKAENKFHYFKKHSFLIILLVLPFIPIAKVARLVHMERLFAIGSHTLWHLLDRMRLL